MEEAAQAVCELSRWPCGLASIPVVSVAPSGAFVNPRYGGLKPYTAVEWTAERIEAEELACVVAIPNAFIDDSDSGGVAHGDRLRITTTPNQSPNATRAPGHRD